MDLEVVVVEEGKVAADVGVTAAMVAMVPSSIALT